MKEEYWNYPDFHNVKELIYYVVSRYSNNNAFILKKKIEEAVEYKNITYKEFLDDLNNFGQGLFDMGYANKRIGIIGKNRYEWVLIYFSALLGNMEIVPLDKGLQEQETELCIVRGKINVLFYDDSVEEMINSIRERGHVKLDDYITMCDVENQMSVYSIKENGKQSRENGNEAYEKTKIDNDKMSVLCFTSGTSAVSKIVMLSHRNIAFDMSATHAMEDFRNTDVNLAFIPLHHTFGCNGVLFIMSYGAATAFPDGLRYIQSNLKEYGVTVFIGVPLLIESMYKKIMKEVSKQKKEKLINFMRKATKLCPFMKRIVFKKVISQLGGKLRLMISGAASIDQEVCKFFDEIGIKVIPGYGLTECSPVAIAESPLCHKYGSIGEPIRGVEVKIVDKNEQGIGEIAIKGDNVMIGYYENEEATKEVFRDGWLLTGDLAYMDTKGRFYITGRKKNVIITKNGKNIYPEEIEFLINKIPEVNECMVYAIPKDDDMILAVKVQYDIDYLKIKYPNLDFAEIDKAIWEKIKEINKGFPTYKYVKHMIATEEPFIKTTTAKIKRHEEIEKINNEKK
ncbi:MAG: AMP-binding protein [Clostridia bacterium]|nr:AMP-binding protein [Clostridia bacterium]